ncbi:hypothetical protein ACFL0Q_04870 [Thermodesulfobacteriota bacterium]
MGKRHLSQSLLGFANSRLKAITALFLGLGFGIVAVSAMAQEPTIRGTQERLPLRVPRHRTPAIANVKIISIEFSTQLSGRHFWRARVRNLGSSPVSNLRVRATVVGFRKTDERHSGEAIIEHLEPGETKTALEALVLFPGAAKLTLHAANERKTANLPPPYRQDTGGQWGKELRVNHFRVYINTQNKVAYLFETNENIFEPIPAGKIKLLIWVRRIGSVDQGPWGVIGAVAPVEISNPHIGSGKTWRSDGLLFGGDGEIPRPTNFDRGAVVLNIPNGAFDYKIVRLPQRCYQGHTPTRNNYFPFTRYAPFRSDEPIN